MYVLWPLWSVKTNVYYQVGIKVTVSKKWLRLFSVVICTNLFILAEWAAAWSYSGALAISFAGDNATSEGEVNMLCWRHPWPSNMASTVCSCCSIPSPTHCITGVWASDCFQMNAAVSKVHLACCLGRMDSSDYGPWVSMTILVSFTECESQFLVYIRTVQSNARDAACDMSQCWGWLGFVWWWRECPWSPRIHAMHSMLFVFLIETVQTQCHNQWTHGRGGGASSNAQN